MKYKSEWHFDSPEFRRELKDACHKGEGEGDFRSDLVNFDLDFEFLPA